MPITAFKTDEDGLVLVEERLEDIGYESRVSASRDERLESRVPLATAIHDAIVPVANALRRAAADQSGELHVEFAVRMHHDDGAVISLDDAASHFKVTYVWRSG